MKYFITVTTLAAILAGGGASDQTEQAAKEVSVEHVASTGTEQETSTDQEIMDSNEVAKESPDEESDQQSSEVSQDFPEYETLAEHIDLDRLEQEIVEDNQSKRVIIFKSTDGEQEYKSIFVKETDRLKIIPIGPGAPLYNDVI
ncbi:hypothetical protein [Gracilibacillus alcaliphilus]|uniref:hypothetical protein n=1 Tax=Gracilibacillus alcaliphilus TaxID=1401441 RepID=UPI0019575CD1|nr:hypothetical protein [Gracilibacillus alcaliphilus]MBM7676249.1 hypothetical protein [Gracilibacillus alcaliphilus]